MKIAIVVQDGLVQEVVCSVKGASYTVLDFDSFEDEDGLREAIKGPSFQKATYDPRLKCTKRFVFEAESLLEEVENTKEQ